MKVYVVGTCQAPGLTACLALMCPDLTFETLPYDANAAAVATDDDLVFRQRDPRLSWTQRERARNERTFPLIYFNAFHPDLVCVRRGGRHVASPLAGYHSSLAFYGWRRGLTVAQTLRLFNDDVYERLSFYDCWDTARDALLAAGDEASLSVESLFPRWARDGCFMHTINHPKLRPIADIARALARDAGLPVKLEHPEDLMDEPLLQLPVWPVYPEVGRRLGLPGSYAFKPSHVAGAAPRWLDLEQFVAQSFATYARFAPSELVCPRVDTAPYLALDAGTRNGMRPAPPPAARSSGASPYHGLPAYQFWTSAVANVEPAAIDPVVAPPFSIDTSMRIATIGSCFAQHISRTLRANGYNYYVAEPAPEGLTPAEAGDSNYGVFSARYGNVYTARQMLQLFDRAYETFVPADVAWPRDEGGYADPFRPRIEPSGFPSIAALIEDRKRHLAAVRKMFETLDVLIVTLGLTEAWRAKADGAVFPLAPGVTAGRADADAYEFVNFGVAEVTTDLNAFLARLAAVNAAARVVLTVSPVPLNATFEPRHVLVSTTYSKAVLRAAAGECEASHPLAWYFPSYELITSAFSRGAYYGDDLRTITAHGIRHVMRAFGRVAPQPAEPTRRGTMLDEMRKNMDVVCDEEIIAVPDDGLGAAR